MMLPIKKLLSYLYENISKNDLKLYNYKIILPNKKS